MPTVHIPASMRSLTGGETDIVVTGSTLGEVIAHLETLYPGLQSRLVEGERIRPGMSVFVDGVNVPSRLSTPVAGQATLYFVPALSGG